MTHLEMKASALRDQAWASLSEHTALIEQVKNQEIEAPRWLVLKVFFLVAGEMNYRSADSIQEADDEH